MLVNKMDAFSDALGCIAVAGRCAIAIINAFRIVRLKIPASIKSEGSVLIVHHGNVVKGARVPCFRRCPGGLP